MFLIDDILLAPAKGLLYIFKEIQKRAEEEMRETPEKLKGELLELQRLLETDRISEAEYSRREKNVLERLNTLQSSSRRPNKY